VNYRYNEVMPRATRYVVGRHISSYVEVRAHLDRLTYTDLIWMLYHLHPRVRPFESISLFQGLIRYGEKIQIYMPDRVLLTNCLIRSQYDNHKSKTKSNLLHPFK